MNYKNCLISTLIMMISCASFSDIEIYRAEYTGQYKGLDVKTSRSLSEPKPGQYRYQFSVRHPLAKLDESSEFIISSDGQLLPLRYIQQKKIFGFGSKEQLFFDWQQQAVNYSHSKKKKRNGTVTLEPGLLDPLLFQLALQEDLANNSAALDYNFVKRTSLKYYEFERLKEENIEISGEIYKAVLVSRTNIKKNKNLQMWFVPELDYQIGKIRYQEKGGDEYELNLVKYHVKPERLQQWRMRHQPKAQ